MNLDGSRYISSYYKHKEHCSILDNGVSIIILFKNRINLKRINKSRQTNINGLNESILSYGFEISLNIINKISYQESRVITAFNENIDGIM